jgi:hypothetical protein
MPSYAFFFHADAFESRRQLVRAGTAVPIDHVGATPRRPITDLVAGDELFIVGLSGNHLHLAGRLVVAGSPMSRSAAVARTGRRDFIDKALICLADPGRLDVFRPDLRVPAEMARELELFGNDGQPVNAEGLRQGRFELSLLRACPRLSPASAARLRALLGLGRAPGAAARGSGDGAAKGLDNDEHRLMAIEARRGQAAFRTRLLQAYGGRCAITSCSVEALLETAHIALHTQPGDERVSNALLLRSDIHTLFDLDLIAIDEHHRVHVSPLLRDSEYWAYDSRQLEFPDGIPDHQPDREALKARRRRLKA